MTSIEIPSSIAAAFPTLCVFDITNELSRNLSRSGVDDGIAYVSAGSTSSLVRVSEREAGFFCDIESLLARLVPEETVDRERLLMGLLGPRTEQIPFSDGALCLGQWQRVLLFGLDGSASADYTLTLVG